MKTKYKTHRTRINWEAVFAYGGALAIWVALGALWYFAQCPKD